MRKWKFTITLGQLDRLFWLCRGCRVALDWRTEAASEPRMLGNVALEVSARWRGCCCRPVLPCPATERLGAPGPERPVTAQLQGRAVGVQLLFPYAQPFILFFDSFKSAYC